MSLPSTGPDGAIDPLPDPVLVHDYLLVLRGAERTFAVIADEWPTAPIATLLYDEGSTRKRFAGHRVSTSPLQRLGVDQRDFRKLLPAFPIAARHLPVGGHELILSSSSAFAHGVRADPGSVHVCYCHSPFRYIWHERERLRRETPRALQPAVPAAIRALRRWDRRSVDGVSAFIANSTVTQERIRAFWNRDASLVHPPVDVDRFRIGEPAGSALVVCELVAHKRVGLALESARLAGWKVRVVGTGPDDGRLRALFGDVATFLGRIDDAALEDEYAQASVMIVPNVEEFGIAAVEAQASGCPVLAVGAGGALETVLPERTGVLVPEDDPSAMAEALRHTAWERFDRIAIREHAARFGPERFRTRLRAEVATAIAAQASR